MRAVVIGGSISGLAFAIFAAARGVRVTVLDADADANPDAPLNESLVRTPRRPTPQSAHSHAFLARTHQILAHEAPDVLDAFALSGIESVRLADHLPSSLVDRAERPGDDALIVLRARRSTFEAALRSVAASTAGIEIRAGVDVTGLLIDRSHAIPNTTGVTTSAGPVEADVVIDASGRRGPVSSWLAGEDLAPTEDVSDCGIAYYTRFYRRYFGERLGGLNRGYTAGSSFDRYSALVFPSDNGTFSVTFGILPEDSALRKLRYDESFAAAAGSIPVVADWVERAEPISSVRSMTGMKNRIRRLVTTQPGGGERPVVTGLVPIGDAVGISNPAHSRGCSLAISHALRVAQLLDENSAPPMSEQFAMECDALAGEIIAPWVEDSRRQDEARLSRWRPDGDHVAPALPTGEISNGEAWTAAHHDRDVWSRFTGLQQLLLDPRDVLADATTISRVRAVQERGLGLPALTGPTHDELAQLLIDAAPPKRSQGGRAVAAV